MTRVDPGGSAFTGNTYPVKIATVAPDSASGYSASQIEALLANLNPAAVAQAGNAHTAASATLADIADALNQHAQVLSDSWQGTAAEHAITSFQQLQQTASDLAQASAKTGSVLSWLGETIFPFYKSYKPPGNGILGDIESFFGHNPQDTAARQVMVRLNNRLVQANANLPDGVTKNLPQVNAPAGAHTSNTAGGGTGGGFSGGGAGGGAGGLGGGPGAGGTGGLGGVGPGPGIPVPGGPGPGGIGPGGVGPGPGGGFGNIGGPGPLTHLAGHGPAPAPDLSGVGPGPGGGGPGPGIPGPGGTGPGGVGPGPGGIGPGPGGGGGAIFGGMPPDGVPGGAGGTGGLGRGGLGGEGGLGDEGGLGEGLGGEAAIGPDGMISATPGSGAGLGTGAAASAEGASASEGAAAQETGMPMMMGGGAAGDRERERQRQAWMAEDADVWEGETGPAPPLIGS